jgi:hypothetical protein
MSRAARGAGVAVSSTCSQALRPAAKIIMCIKTSVEISRHNAEFMPPAGSPCAPSSGIIALMRRSFVSTAPTGSSALSCSMHGAGCQLKLASQRSRGGCHTQRIPIIARHRDRHSVGRHMTARRMKPKPKMPLTSPISRHGTAQAR